MTFGITTSVCVREKWSDSMEVIKSYKYLWAVSMYYRAVRWYSVPVVNKWSKITFNASYVFPSSNHKVSLRVIQHDSFTHPVRHNSHMLTTQSTFFSFGNMIYIFVMFKVNLHMFSWMNCSMLLIHAHHRESHLTHSDNDHFILQYYHYLCTVKNIICPGLENLLF